MQAVNIKDEIKSVLSDDSELSTFGLKRIFEGDRENVSKTDYPCIMIELLENEELKNDVNGQSDLLVTFAVVCAMEVRDPDDQLDEILNFEKLVKKVLSTNYNLNSEAIRLSFDRTVYDSEFWPVRGAIITVQVLYRQSFLTRT